MKHLGRQKVEMGAASINANATGANGVKSKHRFTVVTNEVIEMTNQSVEDLKAGLKAKQESLMFMQRNFKVYNNCLANNNLLAKYIVDNNLEWNQENLQNAFEILTYEQKLVAPVDQPPTVDKAVQEKEAAEAGAKAAVHADPFKNYPLPENYSGRVVPNIRTKRDIGHLSTEEYRYWFHHSKVGAAFRARVDFIGRGGGQ